MDLECKEARPIEVFTGAGRRRAWGAEEKARIVRELCWRLGDGRSGGVVGRHFDDLDAVLEFDTLDDLWQLVFSL